MTIADRVRERIDALDTNPAELARKLGLKRTFVSDLLLGKKQSVRGDALMNLAAALDCDPEYLTGRQAAPRATRGARAPAAPQVATIPVLGVCEAGVFRPPGAIPPLGSVPVAPDLRFPLADQVAFFVKGGTGAKIGVGEGAVVCGVKPPRDGSIPAEFASAPLVVRQTRKGGDVETSIRKIEFSLRGATLSSTSEPTVPALPFPGSGIPAIEIIAFITSAIILFGG